MIHSSNYKPRVFPIFADLVDTEIDRAQDLSSTATLNRTKIEEVGRAGLIDWRQTTPNVTVNLRQLEYGSLEFFRQVANKGSTVSQISWTDFSTSSVDIAGYKTDDNGTFLGTVWYPDLRVSGLSLNIGAPDALIERSWSFAGEDEIALINNNKYLIHARYVISSTGNNRTVSLGSNPTPVADPDNSGRILFRVVKVSGGTATLLTPGVDWSTDGVTLTINGSSTAGDVVWVWYSAATQGGQTIFVNNDADVAGIPADACTILLATNNTVSRLQSVSIDTTIDRRDLREIGSKDVVQRGVRDITNRITLGRILETYTIEEVLRGKAGQSYGKIDIRNLQDNLKLIVKLYSDSTKSTFKMGYEFTDLAPVGRDTGTPVNDYISAGNTLEGETGFVTTTEAILV